MPVGPVHIMVYEKNAQNCLLKFTKQNARWLEIPEVSDIKLCEFLA